MNKENLTKLADFLETKITDDQFNIEYYRSNNDSSPAHFVELTDCGTVGCALGWAPFVVKPVDDFVEGLGIIWSIYSNQFVPMRSPLWEYMFSSDWSRYELQRTRLSTVKRIRKVVSEVITEDIANKVVNRYL